MPTIANDIPFEIWELIASYLPKSQRPRLISVSRYCFFIILHERYGDIQWTTLDKEMVRCLQRLQDPFVARFVQKVHIQAWFINHLVQREALLRKSDRQALPTFQFLAESVGLGVYFPTSWKRRNVSAQSTQHTQHTQYTPGEILSLMVKALSQMTNLTCYSFEWRDLPINKDSQTFLEMAQKSARGLRKLILHAQIPNFKHLLNCVDFECLEELSLKFDYDANNDKSGSDNSIQSNMKIMKTNIAGFINRFTCTLHRLSLSSDSKTPITSPREIQPSIATRAPECLQFSCSYITQHRFQPMVKYEQSSSPNVLSDLESLFLPASIPFETTMMLLRRSANTLTRLSLPGRYLCRNEVEAICDIFSQRPLYASLSHLRLEVLNFNLTLLAEIAERFPRLETLILVTFKPLHLTTKEYGTSLDPFMYNYEGEFFAPTLPPEATLRPHIFQTLEEWRLEDFSIYVERYQEHQTKSFVYAEMEHRAMLRVKQYVPLIRFFKGEEATDGSEFRLLGTF